MRYDLTNYDSSLNWYRLGKVGSGSADHPDCTMDAESRLTAAMAPALPKLDVSALQGAITEAKVCLDLIYLRPRAQLQCPALICVVLG